MEKNDLTVDEHNIINYIKNNRESFEHEISELGLYQSFIDAVELK